MNEPRCVLNRDSNSVFIQEYDDFVRLTIGRDGQGESTHVELAITEARILAYELLRSALRTELAFNSALHKEMKKMR
jgi:hypothetical protein